MMLVATCVSCRYGNHEGHVERVSPPKGMFGGFECPCKGDCISDHKIRREIDALRKLTQEMVAEPAVEKPDSFDYEAYFERARKKEEED